MQNPNADRLPQGIRRAWITGAGKGIGRALALALAADGWRVAASARTKTDLESLANEARGFSGQIHIVPLDVRDEAAVLAAVNGIEQAMGPLDLAVLNAGTHRPVGLDDFSPDLFRKLFEVNVMGVVNGLAAVLPCFRERGGGHVAVVASLAGYRGLPTAAAYSMTKAGLIALCESLKPELDRAHIALTLINPGFVRTPLTDRNDFPMPFLISAEDAAAVIVRGLERRDFEIAFPMPFALVMKCLRILPDALFFRLARRWLP
jgi:short-subunit dehydrogenase